MGGRKGALELFYETEAEDEVPEAGGGPHWNPGPQDLDLAQWEGWSGWGLLASPLDRAPAWPAPGTCDLVLPELRWDSGNEVPPPPLGCCLSAATEPLAQGLGLL